MKIQLFELSELISDMAKNKQDIDHCSFAYSHIIIKLAESLDPTESCGDEYDIRTISPRLYNKKSGFGGQKAAWPVVFP